MTDLLADLLDTPCVKYHWTLVPYCRAYSSLCCHAATRQESEQTHMTTRPTMFSLCMHRFSHELAALACKVKKEGCLTSAQLLGSDLLTGTPDAAENLELSHVLI